MKSGWSSVTTVPSSGLRLADPAAAATGATDDDDCGCDGPAAVEAAIELRWEEESSACEELETALGPFSAPSSPPS